MRPSKLISSAPLASTVIAARPGCSDRHGFLRKLRGDGKRDVVRGVVGARTQRTRQARPTERDTRRKRPSSADSNSTHRRAVSCFTRAHSAGSSLIRPPARDRTWWRWRVVKRVIEIRRAINLQQRDQTILRPAAFRPVTSMIAGCTKAPSRFTGTHRFCAHRDQTLLESSPRDPQNARSPAGQGIRLPALCVAGADGDSRGVSSASAALMIASPSAPVRHDQPSRA